MNDIISIINEILKKTCEMIADCVIYFKNRLIKI